MYLFVDKSHSVAVILLKQISDRRWVGHDRPEVFWGRPCHE